MYEAYSDYQSMMNLAEEIITRCALAVHGKLTVDYQVDVVFGQLLELRILIRKGEILEFKICSSTQLDCKHGYFHSCLNKCLKSVFIDPNERK